MTMRTWRGGAIGVLGLCLTIGCGPAGGAADGAAGSGGPGGAGGGAGTPGSGGAGPGGTGGGPGAVDSGAMDLRGTGGATADAAIDGPSGGADASADIGPAALALTPVRTYAFHELTALTSAPTSRPALSADGRVIAFAQGLSGPPRVIVNAINADGTGLQELDRYEALCFCAGVVEISGDGAVVVSSDSVQIRVARGGPAGRTILSLDSNEIWDIRLTPDGGRVFFLMRRGARIRGTSTDIERGVWVINVDGSGLRQVTGAAAMAAAFARPVGDVFPISGCGRSLDVSNDGTKVAFAAKIGAVESVFAVNGDGSGLRKLVDASGGFRLVREMGLSGDGRMVAFDVYVGDNVTELGVIGFDGGGRRKLAGNARAGCENRFAFTSDAGKLYASEPGLLYNTDGSGVLALSIAAFRPPGGAPVKDGTPWGRMKPDGTRFSFVNQDDKQMPQLMILDVYPGSPGSPSSAPTVADATFAPGTVKASGLTMATATVRASGPGLLRVGLVFTMGGLADVIDRGPGVALNDMGKNGDVMTGDGVFTGHDFGAYEPPKPGPRALRFTAESRTGERRHATVLEASGVVVE